MSSIKINKRENKIGMINPLDENSNLGVQQRKTFD